MPILIVMAEISQKTPHILSVGWLILKIGLYLILALASQEIVVVAYQQF